VGPRLTHVPRIAVDLSPRALLAAGVSGVLAADLTAAEGGRWTLATTRADLGPGAVQRTEQAGGGVLSVVTVRGPIDQRASEQVCGGVTDGYDTIEARFQAACRAVQEAGSGEVQLHVDSPGGMTTGMVPTARRMRAYADKLGVSVSSVADEVACSAALALLLVADAGKVHVPPSGRTASIGVVIMRQASDDAGKIEVFRSGERKMRPNSVEALDAADREDLQARVDDGALEFAQWVAERRGGTAQKWLDLKGASMNGTQAMALGLIDSTKNTHEVIDMANAQAALDSIAGKLGLPAGASAEDIERRATEAAQALAALPAVKAEHAKAAADLLALQNKGEQEKAQTAAQRARESFASDVLALRTAGRVTPAAASALLGVAADPAKGIEAIKGHYDTHGEASARHTLALVTMPTPIVPTGARAGAVPVPASGGLTDAQRAHCKAIGANETEYAVAMLGGKASES
jgi:ClpP class serine protease